MPMKGYKRVILPKPKAKEDTQKNKNKHDSRTEFLKFAAQKCR